MTRVDVFTMRETPRARTSLPTEDSPRNATNIFPTSADVQEKRPADVRSIDPVPGLVGKAKEGDEDAFGQLYRLHHAGIARMARFHLGTDADDVVSEVFLRAWTALPRYRDTGAPFAAWLYGIARHIVADEIARRVRARPVADVPDRGVAFHEDDRMMLAEVIAKLPDQQRRVIELKYLLGLRNPEVAEALGISIGAVNAKQWRALAALRGLLGGER